MLLNYLVSEKEVEIELLKHREEIYRFNKSVSYYHGNIDRNTAEKLLRDYYTQGKRPDRFID